MRLIQTAICLLAFFTTTAISYAGPVSPATQQCIRTALNRTAAAGSNQAALSGLYAQYFGDALAIRAAKPGFWNKFSESERNSQRNHAKKMTLSVVGRLAQYAHTPLVFVSDNGGVIRGTAKTNTVVWHMAGACSFADVYINGISLAITIGKYKKQKE